MERNRIEQIFTQKFDFGNWKGLIADLFDSVHFYKTPIESIDKSIKYHGVAKSIKEFGHAQLVDNKLIKFYDIELENDRHVTKNRVGLRNLIHSDVIPGDIDAIFAVYHTEGDSDWRLTFISKSIFWDNEFNEYKNETNPKRFTYVLGENESVKTAISQFEELFKNSLSINHLIEAFSVEKLNKEFFKKYKIHYQKFWEYIEEKDEYLNLFNSKLNNYKAKAIRDFAKKLLGRIVFLHFLQKKGWLGCTPDKTGWENGEKQFMIKLLEGFKDKSHFHSKCLTELFFNTLNNKERTNYTISIDGLSEDLNNTKAPYLNGGLFEPDKPIKLSKIDFPVSFFEELFEFFSQYNFTIDENSPDDHEVGIDPEMLGHIFENLLEENKEKGAFYTPKEIVQYMTQESLIEYLQTHLGERAEIKQFIRQGEKGDELAKNNFIRENAKEIERLLDNIKICDPAIGSGAFPMGMLQEIFKAKMSLDWTLDRATVKKNIIQNSIYGVDLETGAVDIARLRFWLALVVDEDEPQPLPNLDYKIMQGNSLLESFEGIDLSTIHEGKSFHVEVKNEQVNLFSGQVKKQVSQTLNFEKIEDLISEYFNKNDPEEKKELHQKIDKHVLDHIHFTLEDYKGELQKLAKKTQKKIKNKSSTLKTGDQKIKYENESKDAKSLKTINKDLDNIINKEIMLNELYYSDERPFFLWHLFFKEVFDHGGFDIVIGNPPWGANIPENLLLQIKNRNNDIIMRMVDSFMFFLNESKKLVKHKGIVSKIVPEVILNQQDNALLRGKIINETTLLNVVNLGDDVFEGVTRASCIVQFRNTINDDYKYEVNTFNKIKGKVKFLYTGDKVSKTAIKSLPNNIFPSQELHLYKILGKLFTNEVQALSTLIDEDGIQRGVSPDLKSAFIVSADGIKTNALEKDFLRETVTGGRDINKYGFKWNGKYIIYTDRYTPIDQIPNIIKYISQFENEITCKEVIQGKHPLHALHRARKEQIFKKESKIIGVITGDRISVAYDSKKLYPTDGIYLLSTGSPSNDKALVGILNSSLITLLYRLFSNEKGKILAQIKPKILDKIPIIQINEINKKTIGELVDMIIFLSEEGLEQVGNNSNLTKSVVIDFIENILNAYIYELYFEQHMKEREIDVISYINSDINMILEDKPFHKLSKDEKSIHIIELYKNWIHPDNPTRNRMKLFAIKSPEILMPIIESTQ